MDNAEAALHRALRAVFGRSSTAGLRECTSHRRWAPGRFAGCCCCREKKKKGRQAARIQGLREDLPKGDLFEAKSRMQPTASFRQYAAGGFRPNRMGPPGPNGGTLETKLFAHVGRKNEGRSRLMMCRQALGWPEIGPCIRSVSWRPKPQGPSVRTDDRCRDLKENAFRGDRHPKKCGRIRGDAGRPRCFSSSIGRSAGVHSAMGAPKAPAAGPGAKRTQAGNVDRRRFRS